MGHASLSGYSTAIPTTLHYRTVSILDQLLSDFGRKITRSSSLVIRCEQQLAAGRRARKSVLALQRTLWPGTC